jgi:hypothetical protein
VHFVIIVEKSMLGQRTLAMIDSRFRQFFPEKANNRFGNFNIALVGDFENGIMAVFFTKKLSPPNRPQTAWRFSRASLIWGFTFKPSRMGIFGLSQ